MKEQRRGSGVRGPGSARTVAATAVAFSFIGIVSAETVRLTAEEAAARAVAASHVAAAAGERLAAAQAAVRSADAAALPQVAASASLAQRSSVPEFVLPFALPGQAPLVLVPDITTTYGAAVRLQQTLYAGGAVDAARESSRHDRDATAAARSQAEADLRLAGRTAYWQAVRAAADVEAARAQEARARRLLADTEDLLRAGMAVKADVLAAQGRAESARVAVIAAETASANAESTLASLLGLAPDGALELADSASASLPAPPAAQADLEAAALAGRPELSAAAAAVEGARSRERLVGAALRPALAGVAQWEYDRPNQRYFPTLDRWKESWSVGVAATWTLYDGGRARADGAGAQAAERAIAADREETERRVRLDVATARRNLASALAAVDAAAAARAAAEEREVAARERHAAGLAAMVDVLDAQAQLAAAEQGVIDARAAAWLSEAALSRAVGR